MAGSANLRGAGIALVAMAVYATHDVIVKTLGASFPSHQILFFSQLLAFPLISVILLGDRSGASLWPRQPAWVALRSAAVVLAGLSGFYAFSHLPMAQVYAILFSTPLIITLLSIPMLKERVGAHRWAAVIVGLAGVLIVLRPGQSALTPGHLAALVGACSSALAAVLVRRLGSSERPVTLLLWPMLGNFILTGAMLGIDYEPMGRVDLLLAGGISLLGLIGAYLVIRSYHIAEAAVVAPMQYSQMIWAIIFGVLLFDEFPDLPTLAGAAVIIASGMYIVLREGRGVSANSPVTASRLRPETVTSPKSSLLQRLWPGRNS